MNREEIAQVCHQEVLAPAARLFATSKEALNKFEDSEGCANLVYQNVYPFHLDQVSH